MPVVSCACALNPTASPLPPHYSLTPMSIYTTPTFDFFLGTGLSDASPDEGLLEDLTVEDKAVEQLAEGLLSHYLPDLQRSKQALQELT